MTVFRGAAFVLFHAAIALGEGIAASAAFNPFSRLSADTASPSARTNERSVTPMNPNTSFRYASACSAGEFSGYTPPRAIATMTFFPPARPCGPVSV